MPRKIEPAPAIIVGGVTLSELRAKTGIMAPPLDVVLGRYGFDRSIGVDHFGDAAVPVEVAAKFLSAFSLEASNRASKLAAYRTFLNERKARSRRERSDKLAAQHSAAVARATKQNEGRRIQMAQDRLEAEKAQMAERGVDFVSFEEFEKLEG